MPIYKEVVDESFEMVSSESSVIANNYSVITSQTRLKLIQLVCVQKMPIPKAAQQLQVKSSTAKYIIRSFKRKGKIMKKCGEEDIDDQLFNERLKELKQKEKLANESETGNAIKSGEENIETKEKTKSRTKGLRVKKEKKTDKKSSTVEKIPIHSIQSVKIENIPQQFSMPKWQGCIGYPPNMYCQFQNPFMFWLWNNGQFQQ